MGLPVTRAVANAQGTRGFHVFQGATAQELCAHQMHQTDPTEQQQDRQQNKEAGREDRGEDDQDIEMR